MANKYSAATFLSNAKDDFQNLRLLSLKTKEKIALKRINDMCVYTKSGFDLFIKKVSELNSGSDPNYPDPPKLPGSDPNYPDPTKLPGSDQTTRIRRLGRHLILPNYMTFHNYLPFLPLFIFQ